MSDEYRTWHGTDFRHDWPPGPGPGRPRCPRLRELTEIERIELIAATDWTADQFWHVAADEWFLIGPPECRCQPVWPTGERLPIQYLRHYERLYRSLTDGHDEDRS